MSVSKKYHIYKKNKNLFQILCFLIVSNYFFINYFLFLLFDQYYFFNLLKIIF
jgi:hypothetical protein